MKMNRLLGCAGILTCSLALGACDSDPAGSDTTRLSVLLTDAPGDFESAEVEVVEVYLQGSADAEDENGRVQLFSGSRLFDLMQLRDGVTAEIAEVTIPAGSYSQLRVVIGEATITTEGGTVYSTEDNTLQCPSCSSSGFKVKLPGGAVEFESAVQALIVDFDVAQSFGHGAGKSGRWVMHPVITATSADVAGSIVGTVALATGVTLPACGGGAVSLASFVPTAVAGDVSLSGQTNAEGALRFPFVASGTYTMGYAAEIAFDNGQKLAFTAAPSVAQVTVGAGQTATVDYSIAAASCVDPTPA